MNEPERKNQLWRVREIARLIQADKYPSARELAKEWDLTERVIYKDRQCLVEMGAQIYTDRAHGGWAYRDKSWILGTAYLSDDELSAFFLSIAVARAQGNTGMDELLRVAVGKITHSLGDTISVEPEAQTSFAPSPVATVKTSIYLELTRAAARRQKLRMRYSSLSSDTTNTRTIHPYQLHFARGEWLLIARDEAKAADDTPIRCFNIARIGELNATNEHFVRDLNYDGEKYVAEMFCAERGESVVEVVVRFDEYQARYIRERTWHREQSVAENADGGLTLKFPASGLNEIARWVMSYGRHAQVLAPDELREIVSSHVAAMGEIYGAETTN